MLQNNTQFTTNQYNFDIGVGVSLNNVTPYNPRRAYLGIFVVGANPVSIQFGRPAGNTSDIILSAGNNMIFEDAVPIDSVNLYSELGTTVIISEGNRYDPK